MWERKGGDKKGGMGREGIERCKNTLTHSNQWWLQLASEANINICAHMTCGWMRCHSAGLIHVFFDYMCLQCVSKHLLQCYCGEATYYIHRCNHTVSPEQKKEAFTVRMTVLFLNSRR